MGGPGPHRGAHDLGMASPRRTRQRDLHRERRASDGVRTRWRRRGRGRAGDFVHVPKGAIHREGNPSDEESHLVVVRAGQGPTTINVDGPARAEGGLEVDAPRDVLTTMERLGAPPEAAMRLIVIGAICGLAWAAGFRGFMAEVAGPASSVEWGGTFWGILLPGLVTGALLGWAEHLRRTGGRRGWRWLALAPLSFVVATPGVLVSVFVDAIGAAR